MTLSEEQEQKLKAYVDWCATHKTLDPIGYLITEELEWIESNPERCDGCNHLELFHNGNDAGQSICCIVKNCKCFNHALRS